MPEELQLSEYEKFKWNLLGDVVFEDCYAFWHLWWPSHGHRT